MAESDPIKAARNEGFNMGTIAALACVTAQDCGVTWGEIVRAAGTQEVLRHALINEGDWEWGGFKRYAIRELGQAEVTKARRAVRRTRGVRVNESGKRTTSAAQASSREIPDADECANQADASGPRGVSNAAANGGDAQAASGGCARPYGVRVAAQLYECAECSQPDCNWRGVCDGESCPACGGHVVAVAAGVGVLPAAAPWTVHSRVDCYHEPEFPGDLATFVTIWRAELNHVQLRPGNFTCDDCEEFDTEAEARSYCDRMNAAVGVAHPDHSKASEQ